MKYIRNALSAVLMTAMLVTGIPVLAEKTTEKRTTLVSPYETKDLTIRTPTQTYKVADIELYEWIEDQAFYPLLIDGTTYLPLETVQHLLDIAVSVDILGNTVRFGVMADKVDGTKYEALAEEAAKRQMTLDNQNQKNWSSGWQEPAVFTKYRVERMEDHTTVYGNYILFPYQCGVWTETPEKVRSVGSFVSSDDGWFGNKYRPLCLVCTLEEEPKLIGIAPLAGEPNMATNLFYEEVFQWLADMQDGEGYTILADSVMEWTSVTGEGLDFTLSIPADWAEIALIDTTAVAGDNVAITQRIPVTQICEVREKLAHEAVSDTGLVWSLARWDATEFEKVYGAGDGLVHETVLGCDERYVYTIYTPKDVQYDEKNPRSREQYEKLWAESTTVLEKFYRDNQLKPWHGEEMTTGMAVQVGKYTERMYDETGREVHSFRYGGKLFLPIRGVCDMLGISVDWEEENRTIILGEREMCAPQDTTYREQAEAFTVTYMAETEAMLQKMAEENPEEAKQQGITGQARFTESRIDSFFYETQYKGYTIFSYDCSFLTEDMAQVFLSENVLRRKDGWYHELYTHRYLVFTQGANPVLVGMYKAEAGIYQENSNLFWEGLDTWLATVENTTK